MAGAVLFGQEEYRIEEDGRFVQMLRWEGDDSVLYYEVEIERQEGGAWENVITTETESDFLEVSLASGTYRYRVRAHDFLGRPAAPAEWIQFDVRLAKQPEIVRFSPEAFYLDEDLVWILTLWGRNLAEGAEIYIRNQGIQSIGENRIIPQRVIIEQSEEGAQLVFGFDQLTMGEYTIYMMNPGGLETSLGTFRIAFRKPLDIDVSAGYRPLVPLYGLINDLFAVNIFPLGAYARLTIIPLKRNWGYVGLDLEPSWNYLSAKGDGYEVQAHMAGVSIYGIYRMWFSNRLMALTFRIGGGFYPILDYYFTYSRGTSESRTLLIPAAATGFSFQWFIKRPFFVEAGADFAHLFSTDKPQPGYLRPFFGAGCSF
ncbi:MAG: hypothetical protein LBQ67_07850 [Treponema sp.]|jgi:hypothetical protein|nr:hypothetical protein [Treponema sp.]